MPSDENEERAVPMVLLGAGASVEAGVPASFDMTERLVGAIGEQRWGSKSEALNFVCGALLAYDSAKGTSPYVGLDVERVFAAVELLAERETLEVSPFVASWHPAVDAWDRPNLPSNFDRDLQRQMFETNAPFNRARELVANLVRSLTGGGNGAVYRELAVGMVRELHRLVHVGEEMEKIDYLGPLIRRARTRGGLAIATLNYDRSIELAGRAAQVGVSTGIESWADRRTWEWPSDGIRLLKLHGSIDWRWARPQRIEGHFPSTRVEQVDEADLAAVQNADVNVWDPVLVFGQRGKLRASGPFLSLLAEFEEQLGRADHLIVVGYSFRDEHVNEIIRQWTIENLGRTITVVDPLFPMRFCSEAQHSTFRAELVDSLNPLARRTDDVGVERVTLIRKCASEAFAELFP